MAKLIATRGGVEIDDGVFDATLLSVEQMDPTPNSPNQNAWLKWVFHVYESEEGVEMSAASSINFGPKAKARGWVEAILGRKLEAGEEWDADTFCPKDCQVLVKNDVESGFARIQSVMGVRKRTPPPRRQAQPEGVDI